MLADDPAGPPADAPHPAQRRVVIGRGPDGRSHVASDGPVDPDIVTPAFEIAELWRTDAAPADPTAGDGCAGDFALLPAAGGTALRFVRLLPDQEWKGGAGASSLESVGASSDSGEDASEDLFHRTDTIDYIIVVDGTVVCLLDDGEAELGAGDVLVQCASNHAWSVRATSPCRMIAVLVDAAR